MSINSTFFKLEAQNQKLKNQLPKQFCEKCLAYTFFVIWLRMPISFLNDVNIHLTYRYEKCDFVQSYWWMHIFCQLSQFWTKCFWSNSSWATFWEGKTYIHVYITFSFFLFISNIYFSHKIFAKKRPYNFFGKWPKSTLYLPYSNQNWKRYIIMYYFSLKIRNEGTLKTQANYSQNSCKVSKWKIN